MTVTVKAYLLLGSNLGNRTANLQQAIELLTKSCGNIIDQSSVYETEAWGMKEQQSFLNQAVSIETLLQPLNLLLTIKDIERQMGRTTTVKWGPRIIDIDILFYGNTMINSPALTIPHPYLHERRFTLEPLNEIAPQFIHPLLQQTVQQLLLNCPDKSEVTRFTAE